ncbi:MAG: zinc-dependent metalloprotease [Phycisphaerales bacterium]|nr:zinc-dependent metalloprotease [Phycisphaerales bacterium]
MSSEHRSAHSVLPLSLALVLLIFTPADGSALSVGLWEPMAEQALSVSDSEIIQINAAAIEGNPFQASFLLAGQNVTLTLTPHSVRASGFQVLVSNANGTLTEIDPGPVRTMRGQLTNIPGSVATGSVLPSGLEARIQFPNGKAYGLVALRRLFPYAAANLYALYDESDSTLPAGQCGAVAGFAQEARQQNEGAGNPCEPVGPFVTGLGCDGDSAFVASFPGTPPEELMAAQQFIEDNVNEINTFVYEVQLDTTHEIVRLILRDQANDIYADIPGGSAVLSAVRTEWRTTQADADADLASLWTGRNLDGSVVGRGYVGAICGPGACWVEKRLGNQRLTLLAHELGHNWGAWHCNQDNYPGDMCTTCTVPCSIMRSTLSSCGGAMFSQCSLDEILNRRRNFSCVEDLGFTPPVLTAGGPPLDDGDTVTFEEVLTGETSKRVFQLENLLNCEMPVSASLVGAGGRFRIPEPPTSIAPLGTVNFTVEFSADFAGSYSAGLRIRTPGLIGGVDFTVNLEATAGVGANLPTAPELLCPLNWATTPQPDQMTFSWTPVEFAESFEFRIMNYPVCDQLVFGRTDLQQFVLRPTGLILTPGMSYCWVVIAHNANGSTASPVYIFTVDPDNANPIMDSTYTNIPVRDGDTLNLPLNPHSFVFNFDFHNSGAVPLLIGNLVLPDNFSARWVKFGAGGIGIGGPGNEPPTTGRIQACSSSTLRLTSTLTIEELLQNNIIMDTLEFDTNDPSSPHFAINLCFRCDPLSCVGTPFSGCGELNVVTQGCYHFLADCGTEFGIWNPGNFNLGDRVWISGTVDLDAQFCFPLVDLPHIPDNKIGACFNECGTLVQGTPCVLLQSDSGGLYEVNNLGDFQVGDHVRVIGGLISEGSYCQQGDGQVFDNTIEPCPLGRCCFVGIVPAPPFLCEETTEEECSYYVGGTWTEGLNCVDDPCPKRKGQQSLNGG